MHLLNWTGFSSLYKFLIELFSITARYIIMEDTPIAHILYSVNLTRKIRNHLLPELGNISVITV